MKKFQLVTALHGNEYMPTLAIASMGEEQLVANLKALSLGIRYCEKDMNASFETGGEAYEEKRAGEVLELLDDKVPVVDFHTFSCKSDPFAIIVDLKDLPLASRLGVNHVVYMKHNIKAGHALINHRRGISVEVGVHNEPQSFEVTKMIVQRLEEGVKPTKVRVYEVFGRIEEKGDYTNFEDNGEFVPVLYGERAYSGLGYYGLKAKEITGTIQIQDNKENI